MSIPAYDPIAKLTFDVELRYPSDERVADAICERVNAIDLTEHVAHEIFDGLDIPNGAHVVGWDTGDNVSYATTPLHPRYEPQPSLPIPTICHLVRNFQLAVRLHSDSSSFVDSLGRHPANHGRFATMLETDAERAAYYRSILQLDQVKT